MTSERDKEGNRDRKDGAPAHPSHRDAPKEASSSEWS